MPLPPASCLGRLRARCRRRLYSQSLAMRNLTARNSQTSTITPTSTGGRPAGRGQEFDFVVHEDATVGDLLLLPAPSVQGILAFGSSAFQMR